MICPRCNTRSGLGPDRCQTCGYPFTRRAARHPSSRTTFHPQRESVAQPGQVAPATPRVVPDSRHRYNEPPPGPPRQHRRARVYRRKQGPGSRAIGGLIALLIVTIVIVAAAAVLSSGDRSTRITSDVTDRAGQLIGFSGDDGTGSVEVPEAPAEPAGDTTWVLTEEELNQRIAARSGSFGPADDVRIELNEGTVSVKFRAYGINGTYHGSLEPRDGVPVVSDSTIDGPLGWVVSPSRIDDVLNDEIARAVAEQQVSVESIHIQPGQVVFGVQSG